MLRRRSLLEPQAPIQDWDVVWDYTMGFPEDNGFEKYVQGTPTITLVDDGLNIVNSQDYYVRYIPTEIELQTCNEGILEAEVVFQYLPNITGLGGFRMILSDGKEGCQISTDIDPGPVVKYNQGIQTGYGGLIKIKDISYNVDYVFRIERINQQNRIYLNNELIHQSDIPSGSYASGNRIFFQNAPLEVTLKSIKFKKIS